MSTSSPPTVVLYCGAPRLVPGSVASGGSGAGGAGGVALPVEEPAALPLAALPVALPADEPVAVIGWPTAVGVTGGGGASFGLLLSRPQPTAAVNARE